jgi:hypothetical protein
MMGSSWAWWLTPTISATLRRGWESAENKEDCEEPEKGTFVPQSLEELRRAVQL